MNVVFNYFGKSTETALVCPYRLDRPMVIFDRDSNVKPFTVKPEIQPHRSGEQ